MDNIIVIENLHKSFGKTEILHGINKTFERSKIHGLVGNNGSGKTVLMKCICGFLIPDSGKVTVNGKVIGKDTDFPQNTGIIIETPGFLPSVSGYENLRLLASLRHVIGKEVIYETMKTVGLDPESRKHVSEYSLGMRQRLGIAQAIMESPELLILDEPFNGLDRNGVEEIRTLLLKLCADGITILLSDHNNENIQTLCNTVSMMDAGVIVSECVNNHE